MIVASKQKGETDRRLAPYEPTLRRILRFESYRFLSEDTGAIAVPGKGVLSLGSGHQLELETEQTGEGTRRVRIRWTAGNRVLMNTGLSLRPGVPAVLGGPPWGMLIRKAAGWWCGRLRGRPGAESDALTKRRPRRSYAVVGASLLAIERREACFYTTS